MPDVVAVAVAAVASLGSGRIDRFAEMVQLAEQQVQNRELGAEELGVAKEEETWKVFRKLDSNTDSLDFLLLNTFV